MRQGEEEAKGFVLQRRGLGTAEDYHHVNNNHDCRSLPLWDSQGVATGAPSFRGCLG